MTAQHTAHGHPETAHHSVNLYGFPCVLRTGRLETAARAQEWGYAKLIRADQRDSDDFHPRHFTASWRIARTMECRPLLRVGLKWRSRPAPAMKSGGVSRISSGDRPL